MPSVTQSKCALEWAGPSGTRDRGSHGPACKNICPSHSVALHFPCTSISYTPVVNQPPVWARCYIIVHLFFLVFPLSPPHCLAIALSLFSTHFLSITFLILRKTNDNYELFWCQFVCLSHLNALHSRIVRTLSRCAVAWHNKHIRVIHSVGHAGDRRFHILWMMRHTHVFWCNFDKSFVNICVSIIYMRMSVKILEILQETNWNIAINYYFFCSIVIEVITKPQPITVPPPQPVQPAVVSNGFEKPAALVIDENHQQTDLKKRPHVPSVIRSGTREVHNKLEKNRRAHLKECFELLKKHLPPQQDEKKSSNLSILHSALRYIQVSVNQHLSFFIYNLYLTI